MLPSLYIYTITLYTSQYMVTIKECKKQFTKYLKKKIIIKKIMGGLSEPWICS